MEQNLNVLNQENTTFHLELAAKDNTIGELTREKEKIGAEGKIHEEVLVKRMGKTEELLEEANRTIFGYEMRELANRMEQKDKQES